MPDQLDVRAYLRHSCDVTMSGGNALGLPYPLAACALAEHYVFRRIGGSSTGAVAAAATAAAELGRGAPDAAPGPEAPAVVPGFAGLAQAVGWLAGSRDGHTKPIGGSRHRLVRMLQPDARRPRPLPDARGAAADARPHHRRARRCAWSSRGLGVPGRRGRVLVALTWAAVVAVWLGVTSALVAAARDGAVPEVVPVVTSVGPARGRHPRRHVRDRGRRRRRPRCGHWHARAAEEYFGLVSGVATPERRPGRFAHVVDRWIGLRTRRHAAAGRVGRRPHRRPGRASRPARSAAR